MLRNLEGEPDGGDTNGELKLHCPAKVFVFLALIVFFFIILISSAFELSYTHDFIPIPIMMTLVRICPTKLRVSLSYTRDYILIANFVGMALIPFAILTILNLKLFRTIKVVFFVFFNSSLDAQASLAPTPVSP